MFSINRKILKIKYIYVFLFIIFIFFSNNVSLADDNNEEKYTQHYYKGLEFLRKGLYNKAIDEFKIALEYQPNKADVYFGLGICMYQLKSYDKAKESYIKTLNYKPSPELRAQVYGGLGDIYLKLGDYNSAIEQYEKALSHNSKWLGVRLNLAKAWFNMKKIVNASIEINKLLEIDPGLPEAYQLRSLIKREQGDLKGALIDLEKSINLNPNPNLESYQQLVELYKMNHYYKKAVDLSEKLLQINDYYVDNYKILGDSLFEWWEHEVKIKTGNTDINEIPSYLLDKAKLAYLKSVLNNPDNEDSRIKFAHISHLLGDRDISILNYQQVLKSNPLNLDAFKKLVHLYILDGKINQALDLSNSMIKKYENNIEFWINLGILKKEFISKQEGLEILYKAFYKFSNSKIKEEELINLIFTIGEIEYSIGNKINAKKLWYLIKEKYPDSPYLDIIRAYWLIESGDNQWADLSCLRAQQKNFQLFESYKIRGIIALNNKNYKKALMNLEWAVFLESN